MCKGKRTIATPHTRLSCRTVFISASPQIFPKNFNWRLWYLEVKGVSATEFVFTSQLWANPPGTQSSVASKHVTAYQSGVHNARISQAVQTTSCFPKELAISLILREDSELSYTVFEFGRFCCLPWKRAQLQCQFRGRGKTCRDVHCHAGQTAQIIRMGPDCEPLTHICEQWLTSHLTDKAGL